MILIAGAITFEPGPVKPTANRATKYVSVGEHTHHFVWLIPLFTVFLLLKSLQLDAHKVALMGDP